MDKTSVRRPGPILAVLILAALAVALAFYVRPMKVEADPALLASDSYVSVESSPLGTFFLPPSRQASLGLIFYPGARVPKEAYAYLGRALAKAGYAVVILSLPLNFAVFSPYKAAQAEKALPSVRAWVIGGHSLGGAMAASYCAKPRPKVAGLLFLAAYPGGSANLSASSLPILSISATNDGLATPDKIAASRRLLPSMARFIEISGGNHAQFGEYGLQPGDGTATTSGPAQRQAVVEETLGFMARVLASLR